MPFSVNTSPAAPWPGDISCGLGLVEGSLKLLSSFLQPIKTPTAHNIPMDINNGFNIFFIFIGD
ncbi:hypothetical protein D3C86_1782690 [compost metagenome]